MKFWYTIVNYNAELNCVVVQCFFFVMYSIIVNHLNNFRMLFFNDQVSAGLMIHIGKKDMNLLMPRFSRGLDFLKILKTISFARQIDRILKYFFMIFLIVIMPTKSKNLIVMVFIYNIIGRIIHTKYFWTFAMEPEVSFGLKVILGPVLEHKIGTNSVTDFDQIIILYNLKSNL